MTTARTIAEAAPRPLAWDRGSAMIYGLNSLGAMALSAVSVMFFQDREHDAGEILAGTGFLVVLAWFISFVVAGFPGHRAGPAVAAEDFESLADPDLAAGLAELELEPAR